MYAVCAAVVNNFHKSALKPRKMFTPTANDGGELKNKGVFVSYVDGRTISN